jgi:hypothetical protein
MEAASIRPRRRLRLVLIAVVVAGPLWACWWTLSPDYLDLDIPTPPHTMGFADVWDEMSRAEVRYTHPGAAGQDYVVRRVGTVYPDRHPWQRPEEIVAHFDDWLTARGWIARDIYSEGDPVIPETHFLGKSPAGVRHYTRSGDQWGDECRVVVAVWPIRSGEQVLGHHVVLASVQASFLRRLHRSLD